MLFEDDFALDGISALSMGIVMQNNFKFSGAEPEIEVIQVAGRNGALHRYTGSWLNIEGEVDCYILQDGAAQNLATLGRFLKPMQGYRRLEVQSDPSYYRLARVKAMPDSDIRIELMAPFTLEFDCMPQHFLKIGDREVALADGDTLRNPTNQVAYPTIRLEGTNMTQLMIGESIVNLNGTTGTVVIDSFRQRVYNLTGDLMTPSTLLKGMEFPTLVQGDNGVQLSGDSITCTVTPHWFEV